MAPIKELELWDTYNQEILGKYRTQSSALVAFCDAVRDRIPLDHLDVILQRPHDNPYYLTSGREARTLRWLESLDLLTIHLRLSCGTDVIGLYEFLEFSDIDFYVEDCSVAGKEIDFQRYEAVVSREGNNGSGRGATEIEALARAMVDMEGGYDGLHETI